MLVYSNFTDNCCLVHTTDTVNHTPRLTPQHQKPSASGSYKRPKPKDTKATSPLCLWHDQGKLYSKEAMIILGSAARDCKRRWGTYDESTVYSYKMVHPFCAFFFFFFCFGGWRTTLMAASNTAFMFWRCKAAAISNHKHSNWAQCWIACVCFCVWGGEKKFSTCWVFELHSM